MRGAPRGPFPGPFGWGCAGYPAWWNLNLWTKGSHHQLLTKTFCILNLFETIEF